MAELIDKLAPWVGEVEILEDQPLMLILVEVLEHQPLMLILLVLAVLAVIVATHLVRKARARLLRIHELDALIGLTLKEQDSQVYRALTQSNSLDIDGNTKMWTASQTRLMIAAGRLGKSGGLDPRANVAQLARRCRKYGRDKEGANAISEELYDEAYAEAWELVKRQQDFSDQSNLKPPPPLHGVPLIVKDCVGLKGTLSTGGLACRLNRRDKADCVIMKALKAAGAIPICKGNVCQGMGISESVNKIWGRSRNPWDLSRSPGGSSGGDAALVAMGCAPLSVSADGAGSIRIPASMCGVVGFKPSPARMTFTGSMRPKKDDKYGSQVAIPATMGPMAKTVEDCALFMKAVFAPLVHQLDRSVVPLPFDETTYTDKSKKLKIGYFMTDDWMDPCVTGKRAIKEAINGLERQGHTCVPFKPPTDGWQHNKLFVGITAAEGNMRGYRDGLEGEVMIPEYAPLVGVAALPNFIRPIAKLFLPKRVGHLLECGRNGGRMAHEVWDMAADLIKMKQDWSDAINDHEVDAVIFPSLPIPATRHGNCGKIMSVSYMFIGNLLGWPCGALPITTVREDEQHYRREDLPKDQQDMMTRYASEEMKGSAGLPMSISVMAPDFEDEKCLRVMKVIEKGVKFQCNPTAFKAKDEWGPFVRA